MFQYAFELFTSCGQIFIHHDLKQEPKILTSVETDPREPFIEYQPGRHYFFGKVTRIDPMLLEVIEVQATLFQLIN